MVPQNPNLYVVRAVIPNALNPQLHVLNPEGERPSVLSTERFMSVEQRLQLIGTQAVGAALSIDRLQDRKNVVSQSGITNIADVVAKPVNPENIALNEGYFWGKEES